MLYNALLILVFAFQTTLLKAAVPTSMADFSRLTDDNPLAAVQELEGLVQKTDSADERWGWIVLLHYSMLEPEPDVQDEERFTKARAWAFERKKFGLEAMLMLLQARRKLPQGGLVMDQGRAYEEALILAAKDDDPWAAFLLTLRYSAFLAGQSKRAAAMSQIENAKKMLEQMRVQKEYAVTLFENEFAVFLEAQNRPDEALDLYKHVHEYCEKNRLREFCAKNAFNMGALYSNRTDILQADQAIPYFRTAIAFATEIGSSHRLATATLGLANVAMKKAEWKLAEKHIRDAIPIFEKNRNSVWLGDSWMKLAHVLMKMERLNEAEHALTAARKAFPPYSFADFVELDAMQARVLQKMGKYKEAYGLLESALEGYRKISEEVAQKNFQEKVVSMELDMEAEKRRRIQSALDEQNSLQEHNARLVRWLTFSIGFSLLLIVLLVVQKIRLGTADSKAATIGINELDLDSQEVSDTLKHSRRVK